MKKSTKQQLNLESENYTSRLTPSGKTIILKHKTKCHTIRQSFNGKVAVEDIKSLLAWAEKFNNKTL